MKKNQYKCKVCGKTDPAEFHASKHQLCKEHYYEYLKELKTKKKDVPIVPVAPDDSDDETSVTRTELNDMVMTLKEISQELKRELDSVYIRVSKLEEQVKLLSKPTLPELLPVPALPELPPLPSTIKPKSSGSRMLPLPTIEAVEVSNNERIAQLIDGIKRNIYGIPAINKILSDNGINITLAKTMKKAEANDKAVSLLSKLIVSEE